MTETSSSAKPIFEAAWATDIGRRRSKNQDFAGSFPDHALFIVADGMGGHRGGEIASQMAVEIFSKTFEAGIKNERRTHQELLSVSALEANRLILERSRFESDLEGMGTTTTALHFCEGKAMIGHVGDSRCYLINKMGIWQLTRDHSLVQEKLRAGLITRDQLKTDRMKNVITRSVGFDLQFGIDIYEYEPKIDDLFLMCSDGLTGQVEDLEIYNFAKEVFFDRDPQSPEAKQYALKDLIGKLIDTANERGGDDNITVLATQYLGLKETHSKGLPHGK
jgi:serine/threonine protein phosphatase PrpC